MLELPGRNAVCRLILPVVLVVGCHLGGEIPGQEIFPDPQTLPRLVPRETQDAREFLPKLPPDLIRKGLEPLDPELPDTRLREGLLPPNFARDYFSQTPEIAGEFRGGAWRETVFPWEPSELVYRPLYYEDAMLERHGQALAPGLQPLASAGRFSLQTLALPYNMCLDPPRRPRSGLGHFRAGSPAPNLLQLPAWRTDASLVEVGVIIGLILILP